MSNYKLIIDDREHHVAEHIQNPAPHETVKCRITVGDFIIIRDAAIIAVFERKTYEDFVASICDGRAQNREKLTKLRELTGARVYYIIEGSAPIGMPAQKLKAVHNSITRLIFFENIHIIYTRDPATTLSKLYEIIDAISPEKYSAREFFGGNMQHELLDVEMADADDTDEEKPHEFLQYLKKCAAERDEKQLIRAWSSIQGISVITANKIAARWSIMDVLINPDCVKSQGKLLTAKQIAALANIEQYKDKILKTIYSIGPKSIEKLAPFSLSQIARGEYPRGIVNDSQVICIQKSLNMKLE